MARISNKQVREYVEQRKPFKTANGTIYGVWQTPNLYVVYSYGHHWPLVIYDVQHDLWLRNVSKYSVTTTEHGSTAAPQAKTVAPITIDTARAYVSNPAAAAHGPGLRGGRHA